MIKKGILGVLLVIVVAVAWFYVLGRGAFGGPWQSAATAPGPRSPLDLRPGVGRNSAAAMQIGGLFQAASPTARDARWCRGRPFRKPPSIGRSPGP